MAAFLHYILLFEKDALVEIGIEVRLHPCVSDVCSPSDEVVHALLGTVCVINFQAVTLSDDIVADGFQGLCSLFREHRRRLFITVDAISYEIVGPIISYLQDGVRNGFREQDEGAGIFRRWDGRAVFLAAGDE